jgi:hypothetical protein
LCRSLERSRNRDLSLSLWRSLERSLKRDLSLSLWRSLEWSLNRDLFFGDGDLSDSESWSLEYLSGKSYRSLNKKKG